MFKWCGCCWSKPVSENIGFSQLEASDDGSGTSFEHWVSFDECSTTSAPYDSNSEGEEYLCPISEPDETVGQITMTMTTSSEDITNAKEQDVRPSVGSSAFPVD